MNMNETTSNRISGQSHSHTGLCSLGRMAVATSLVFLTLGGLSVAWAGNQQSVTTPSPYLHLTGVSIHLDFGLLHFGGHHRHYRPTYHHRYRHGHHRGHSRHFAGHQRHRGPSKHFGQRHFRGHDGRNAHRGNSNAVRSHRGQRNHRR